MWSRRLRPASWVAFLRADISAAVVAGLPASVARVRTQSPAGVAFRDATQADLPAIIAMLADDVLGRRREVVGPVPDPRYLAALRAIDADPNQLQVVAVLAGEVVGTLQLTFLPGLAHTGAWRGQLEGVRVAAGQRDHGLGRLMVEWAIERCRTRGCSMVQLTTDRQRPDAHRFYESLGFVPSHLGLKLPL